jgi:hypothetical protein
MEVGVGRKQPINWGQSASARIWSVVVTLPSPGRASAMLPGLSEPANEHQIQDTVRVSDRRSEDVGRAVSLYGWAKAAEKAYV